MTTRLQKLDKLKIPSNNPPPIPSTTNPVNQTIIINNPNININYMNQTSKGIGNNTTRGADNWNLNNNLKEFSQTRQLGFFKKKQRNKSNSPYIIHKVRTQDFRSINKIYAPGHGNTQANPQQAMKETIGNFKKNDTISHIVPNHLEYQKEQTHPQTERNNGNALEKVMGRRDKTITEKFYKGNSNRKNPRIEMLKNFQTLPTNYLTNPQNSIETNKGPKQLRKNRFQIPATERSGIIPPVTLINLSSRGAQSRQSNDSLDSPTKRMQIMQKDERECDSAESQTKIVKNMAPRMVNLELRRRAYHISIASIDKLLLSNAEDYFDRGHCQKLPQSQIQLCVNSLSHPQRTGISKQKSSKRENNQCREYDFMFEEERKKRPKTPRRKKMYEPL